LRELLEVEYCVTGFKKWSYLGVYIKMAGSLFASVYEGRLRLPLMY
jgi:hypothetical protein